MNRRKFFHSLIAAPVGAIAAKLLLSFPVRPAKRIDTGDVVIHMQVNDSLSPDLQKVIRAINKHVRTGRVRLVGEGAPTFVSNPRRLNPNPDL
jgi:hypothetical protein